MKQVGWMALVFLAFFSLSGIFAQSNASAVSEERKEESLSKKEVVKVEQVRKVTKVQQARKLNTGDTQRKPRYDAKGGIIRPNASKGVAQKNLTDAQRQRLNAMKQAKVQAREKKNDDAVKRSRPASKKSATRKAGSGSAR